MDTEHLRFNMIEQQIRPWDVLDPAVLDLLHRVHREDFVPVAHRALAFVDMEIPLGHGAHMLSPKLEARLLQELAIQPTDHILEIGTGSGYFTALLASMGQHVTSVDIEPAHTQAAAKTLANHNIRNVTLAIGDGAHGWGQAHYDVIVLGGSVPQLAPAFEAQLKLGGRLLAIVGDAPAMHAQLITRVTPAACQQVTLFETSVPALQNAPHPQRFVF